MPEDDSGKPGPEENPFVYVLENEGKEGTTASASEKSKQEDSFPEFCFQAASKATGTWHKSGGKNAVKTNETKKSYKPIAPHPSVGDKQSPFGGFVDSNSNVGPILIVKIEDEQLKTGGDDNGKCRYYSDFQTLKKWNRPSNDSDLINDKRNKTKLKCYKCYTCLFMTLSKDSLNYHLEKKGKCYNESEAFRCPGCKNVFYSPTPFRIHLVHDHKMSQREAKSLVESGTGIYPDAEPSETEREKPCRTASERGGKRPTMLETYLDEIEIGSKRDCNVPPPLNRNGSDLLENAFDFAGPHCEPSEPVRSSPALVNPREDAYAEMAGVFRDARGNEEYKGNQVGRFADENDAVVNYLSCQVDEIPVINLDGSNLDKCSQEVLPGEAEPEDFSYPEDDPGPENDEDAEDDPPSEREKKKSKRLGVGYRCDINGCKVRLQSEKNIRYHRRCHEGTLYNCPECCKDCSSWVSLSGHLWQAHKIDMELYKCDQCPYKTPSYSRLTNIHRGIHGVARPFLCDVCGKGFKTVKQMRNHKNVHKAKMVRMSVCHCDICGRTVADKRQLELHVNNTHKKKKPFLCYMCGYASAVKHSLVVHMRRHTGEKPYKCEKCEYKTADHNALRRHKMKHTGARSYKCNHCSYTCIQASTYKVHIKTKHPGTEADVIFSCGQCNFQTLNRGSFLSHTSEHENYNGEIRKQARNQPKQPATPRGHEYYGESDRMDFVGPIISERVVETIVDLSGAHSLLEDDYYEVERITGDLEEAQELKFKTSAIT